MATIQSRILHQQNFVGGLFVVALVASVAGALGSDPGTATDAAHPEPMPHDTVRTIDFEAGLPDDWRIVNDGVMGGRSSSTLRHDDDGFAVFQGDLSLENNGGFASFRADIADGALAGADRLLVRVRGDGHRYQLRLRPGHVYTGIAYTAGFDTPADEWTTVELPVDAFEPTFRGSRPRGAGPLDPEAIGQVGIMLADKRPGPFRLEIAWIGWAAGEDGG